MVKLFFIFQRGVIIMADLMIYVYKVPEKSRWRFNFIVHFNKLKMSQNGIGYNSLDKMIDALKKEIFLTKEKIYRSSVPERLLPSNLQISQEIPLHRKIPKGAVSLHKEEFLLVTEKVRNVIDFWTEDTEED